MPQHESQTEDASNNAHVYTSLCPRSATMRPSWLAALSSPCLPSGGPICCCRISAQPRLLSCVSTPPPPLNTHNTVLLQPHVRFHMQHPNSTANIPTAASTPMPHSCRPSGHLSSPCARPPYPSHSAYTAPHSVSHTAPHSIYHTAPHSALALPLTHFTHMPPSTAPDTPPPPHKSSDHTSTLTCRKPCASECGPSRATYTRRSVCTYPLPISSACSS